MVSEDRINEVIDSYLNAEKFALIRIDEMDGGKNTMGSSEWKLRNSILNRIKLLEDIKRDLI